ncbi:serine/threonine-protein kinase [Pseudonocardia sp.]|uniref:serine/threonine-protein kinase n=1 Tax=Pseudonocardia sp. TaxID=60912 RepID=UPI00262772D1|nr:serine/threonine-protein kinase [Pseudonocardia sp.]
MRLLSGRYELGAVIGTGSSAVVHRAWDRAGFASVAVKLFTAGPDVHDPRRHDREIDALTRVRHPGLVALRDGGIDDGVPYLVLDLVDGPTLAEHLLLYGPLTPEATRRLGARVADALAAVHAAGIVHRDVKPANVLLELDGAPRLTDFGIAHALDATSLTRSGAVVGTVGYLAPEQVRGRAVGVAADVYALGLVLLEAVTGRREYPGTAVESAAARLHRAPAIPRHLPAPLARAIRAMTASDPSRRPRAAAVAELLGTGSATTTMPAWLLAPVRARPWLVAAGGGAVAAAAVVAVLVGGTAVPAGPATGVPAAALVPEPVEPGPVVSQPVAAEPAAVAPAASGGVVAGSVTADPPVAPERRGGGARAGRDDDEDEDDRRGKRRDRGPRADRDDDGDRNGERRGRGRR